MKPGLGLVVLTAAIVFVCALANAGTPLPPAPANGYCYDSVTFQGFNGVRNCPQPPPPPPPAAGRITSSNLAYNGCPTCAPRFVGVTEWTAIWGHATNSDTEAAFPGRSNSAPVIMNFTRGGYVAAHFKPSATGPRYGWIVHTEYNYGADLSWAITRAPGDFNPTDPLCKGSGLSGQPFGSWTTAPSQYHGKCGVAAGVDYYLNIKLTNPAQGTTTCAASLPQCAIGTANAIGP